MQGSNYDLHTLETEMQNLHNNLDDITTAFPLQTMCAEVCIFHDDHIEDKEFADTLRLANDMAIQCIEATTLNMVKSRYESCYACIKGLAT